MKVIRRFMLQCAPFLILLQGINAVFAADQPLPASGQQVNQGSSGVATGGTASTPVLTLDQCIEIALKKNPGMVSAFNTVEAGRSRVGESRSAYYPQINAQAAYTRSNTETSNTGIIPKTSTEVDTRSGSINLYQNIIDFGRTSSAVDISKYQLAAATSDLEGTRSTIIFNVKQAYYTVLQARRNREVATDLIKQFQLHLDQAKGFYDVGTKAKIDVIKAEVDLSNAKLGLIRAENALKIAWVVLNSSMGTPDAPLYTIEDNLSFKKYEITLNEATRRAFENRPDLKAIEARRQAAEENISLQRSGHFPILSGNASYMRSDTAPTDTTMNTWTAGVTLTFPLFNGFLTSHQVAEAKSNYSVVKANEELLRQQVLIDIQQAFTYMEAIEAGVTTAELAAQQAKENMDLANGRYAAGVGSPVEVSDAFATYVSAQANYTSILANYWIAVASLEKAMGVR